MDVSQTADSEIGSVANDHEGLPGHTDPILELAAAMVSRVEEKSVTGWIVKPFNAGPLVSVIQELVK
jgi:hypothetical protein